MRIEKIIGEGPQSVYSYYLPSQIAEPSFPHKIGSTRRDPEARIREQQTGFQEEPVIGTIVRCHDARTLEAQLHEAFAHRRLTTSWGREWFDISPKAVENFVLGGEQIYLPWNVQLRALRFASGLTQTQLADAAGLRQATISSIESGAKGTEIETILEMCRELKVKVTFTPTG